CSYASFQAFSLAGIKPSGGNNLLDPSLGYASSAPGNPVGDGLLEVSHVRVGRVGIVQLGNQAQEVVQGCLSLGLNPAHAPSVPHKRLVDVDVVEHIILLYGFYQSEVG